VERKRRRNGQPDIRSGEENVLLDMKNGEKLCEMKSDEKALSDEELKSFVGEGGLGCSATK